MKHNFHACILVYIVYYTLVFQQILYFFFPTISSRRPNGVYIRGGGSINLWFRSADNKLLLIKCSATYKLKPQSRQDL